MSQNKYKCSGKDVKKDDIQRERNPKKDVELCLEVEMDDEVREIITSPEKCASTLLDVTVIKPKDIDQLCCSQKTTLCGEEVRRLIASMELEKQDRQKLIDTILSSNDTKCSGDYAKKRYVKKIPDQPMKASTTDDTNSDIMYTYKHKPSKKCEEHVQQIYTTPKTYNDIKSIFTCKNKNKYDENEKLDKPCLCRNCAVVGVLTDSQKKPFITENLYDPRDLFSNSRRESKEYKKKKYVNFKEGEHLECEYYYKHLSAKIRKLEERVAVQEEKSVPRDYFKRIITKLVTHLSKITTYTGYDATNFRPKSKESKESKDTYKMRERYADNRYYVHPVLVDHKKEEEKDDFEDFLPSIDGDRSQLPSDSFWKWGEEILKPGIDLKNKIVSLLEDTLHNLNKPKSVPSKLEKEEARKFPEKHPRVSAEVPVRDLPNKKAATCHCCKDTKSSVVKPKDTKTREKKRVAPSKDSTRDLDVSYMNPQVWRWHEESQISFKMDSSDVESVIRHADQKRINENYKSEFRDTLSNTNPSDKMRLWNSIWTQAKMNGQSKDDKVTIQIPERKNIKNNKTIEIEYTIAELEELLVGSNSGNQKTATKNKKGDRK